MGESAELLFRYSVHARVVEGGTEIIRARPQEAYSAPLYSKAQVTPHVGSLDIEIVLMYDILTMYGRKCRTAIPQKSRSRIRQAVWNVEHRNETHKQDKK